MEEYLVLVVMVVMVEILITKAPLEDNLEEMDLVPLQLPILQLQSLIVVLLLLVAAVVVAVEQLMVVEKIEKNGIVLLEVEVAAAVGPDILLAVEVLEDMLIKLMIPEIIPMEAEVLDNLDL
jgi:hypothetical protein